MKNKYNKNIFVGSLIYFSMFSIIGIGFSSFIISDNNLNSEVRDIDVKIGNVNGTYSKYVYIDQANKPNSGYRPLLYKISNNNFNGFINHNNNSNNDINNVGTNDGELLFYINFNLNELKEFNELNVNKSLTFKYKLKLISNDLYVNNVGLFKFSNSKLYQYNNGLLTYKDEDLLSSNIVNNDNYIIDTNTNSVEYSISLANILVKEIDTLETYLVINISPISSNRLSNIYKFLVTNNGSFEFYMDLDKYE